MYPSPLQKGDTIGLVAYTGFTLTVDRSDRVEKTLMSCLLGKSYHVKDGTTVHGGIAAGPLVGGNHC